MLLCLASFLPICVYVCFLISTYLPSLSPCPKFYWIKLAAWSIRIYSSFGLVSIPYIQRRRYLHYLLQMSIIIYFKRLKKSWTAKMWDAANILLWKQVKRHRKVWFKVLFTACFLKWHGLEKKLFPNENWSGNWVSQNSRPNKKRSIFSLRNGESCEIFSK